VLGESFSILVYVNFQEIYWLVFSLGAVVGLIAITFLLEVNRTPFDLSEAESELVAGYTTEYGGFLFGVYYLGEYLHLFFFSLLISSLILGGWEAPRFVVIFICEYFNTHKNIYLMGGSYVIYNFDQYLIDNVLYLGLIIFYYWPTFFDLIINFYDLYFVIVKNYLFYEYDTPIYIYNICLYYFFNDI
jgi:NADH-quinone oxidoreductase subunit H